MTCMPDIWGEGQLLAFSGIDGPTSWEDGLVLATGRRPGDLRLRLPLDLPVTMAGLPALDWEVILGDVLVSQPGPRGRYRGVMADCNTWLGEVPDGVTVQVGPTWLTQAPAAVGEARGAILVGWQAGSRWGLSLGRAAARGTAGREGAPGAEPWRDADLEALGTARMAFVEGVPVPPGLAPGRARLLRKALAVMKVNVCAPEGSIGRCWSTPDRWPHRHLWLWDSAFHAVGMARIRPSLAQDELLAVLEATTPEGMIPHMVQPDGRHSAITQPPLLAWAVRDVLAHGGDPAWARACLPALWRYLEWDRLHRDRNGNHIPEWAIEGDPRCRCGESGLDNSSVYDRAVLLDAPDFAAFLYHDYLCLAELAAAAGDARLAESCRARAAPIATAVNQGLWDEAAGFYFHRDHQGAWVPVRAISGFMPLFAGIATARQAAALVTHLRDPAAFGAPARVPSEALDSGTFCKDMWRGPAWLNLSYLIVLGLRRYGYQAEAAALRDNLLDTVQRWYEREGCLFEYYDALGLTSPRGLDRKQRLVTGKGLAPICDYHWTAAVTAALLLEPPG